MCSQATASGLAAHTQASTAPGPIRPKLHTAYAPAAPSHVAPATHPAHLGQGLLPKPTFKIVLPRGLSHPPCPPTLPTHRVQPYALGVAAALQVEHPLVAPAVLIVADQLPPRICRERGLASACKAGQGGTGWGGVGGWEWVGGRGREGTGRMG